MRAIFFDGDGTLWRWHSMHSYDRAMTRHGLFPPTEGSKVEELLQAYRQRQKTFTPFITELVGFFQQRLRGVAVEAAERVGFEVAERSWQNLYVFPRELLRAAKALQIPCFLISGGPEQVIKPLAERLGFDDHLSSVYLHENGAYTGEAPVHWVSRKDEAVHVLAEKHGIELKESVAIGDTISDVPMLESVAYPICFNPNRELLEIAREEVWPVVIERKDCVMIFKGDTFFEEITLHEVFCDDILPQPLAWRLDQRLQATPESR